MKPEFNKIDALCTEGKYSEAAKLISSLKLWMHLGNSAELIRQQEVISNYKNIQRNELELLIANFLTMLRRAIPMTKRIFIVHGWDHELKLETKNYLQNSLGLDCIILHEQSGEGDTIINKFERCAEECGLAVVLLSEKDAGDSGALGDPNSPKRPRPNVLFELGYFFARLGRKNVLIFRKGNVEIHSDILGIEYIDVTNGVESAGEKIRKRLEWLLAQR